MIKDTKNLTRVLVLHVRKTGWKVDGEDDEDDVRLGVGERSEPVVLLLPRGVPQRELDLLVVELHLGHVVFEHGRDVGL